MRVLQFAACSLAMFDVRAATKKRNFAMPKTHYTLSEMANLCNVARHRLYFYVYSHRLPTIRSTNGRGKFRFMVERDAMIDFLTTVDWAVAPSVNHPMMQPVQTTFRARYIHENDLAAQLEYSPQYLPQWHANGFPFKAIRGGWYNRADVLSWLAEHRPIDFNRIHGKLD